MPSFNNVKQKTIKRLLLLYYSIKLLNDNRVSIGYIQNRLYCCRSTAYRYLKALKVLEGLFRQIYTRQRNIVQDNNEQQSNNDSSNSSET